MESTSKNKKNQIIYFIVNLIWFGIIAYVSYRMPDYVDDAGHRTSFLTGEEIKHLSQIFPSVATYYNIWGGRAVSMVFIQLMLMLPKPVFSILNGIIFCLIANVINAYAHADEGQAVAKMASTDRLYNSEEIIRLSLIFLFLWFFMPDFAEVITWVTGTVTYLWTNLIILAFGLNLYKDFHEQKKYETSGRAPVLKSTMKRIILYTILGFFSGSSTEAAGSAFIFALFLYLIWELRHTHKIAIDHIIGTITTFIGFGVLMLAPGNRVRASVATNASETGNIIQDYAFRLTRETFYSLIFLLIPFTIALALYVYKTSITAGTTTNSKYNLLTEIFQGKEPFFFLIGLAGIYVMTFSAGFANRVFQFPLLMLAISLSISVKNIMDHKQTTALGKALATFCIAMTLMALVEITAGTIYAKSKDSFFDRQMIYYNIYDTEGALSGNGID